MSAAVSLRVVDYRTQGPRSFFRLHEKGGRYNVVPAHHTAQEYVDAYLQAARIGEDRRGPLFRSCEPGRRDALQEKGMSRVSALKMIKRRARKAGLPAEICAHSLRGTGITEYLRNGGDLEVAARIAGHESTRTTQLYNRLQEEISLDEIERIHIPDYVPSSSRDRGLPGSAGFSRARLPGSAGFQPAPSGPLASARARCPRSQEAPIP